MPRTTALLAVALALMTLLLAAACRGTAVAATRAVSDGILRVPLPRGWFGSVGPGTQGFAGHPHRVSWMLAGNFSFARDAAAHEGRPSVPPGKVLLSLGDFVLTGRTLHWRQTKRLHLPPRSIARGAISWHVRFAGRAVSLTVRFGSKPNARTAALVNAVLGSVSRVQRMVAGVELVPASARVCRQCQTAADWVGYPVPCPRLLPRGAHPTTLGWPVAELGFISASTAGGQRWALGSIEFPASRRVGHLTLQASPRPIRDATRFVDAQGWTRSAPMLPLRGSVRVNGWNARFVDAEKAESFSQHHVVLMWTVGGHSYGIAFHGRDRGTYALDLAIARATTLVLPTPGVRHERPLEILPPAALPAARKGTGGRLVAGVELVRAPPGVRRQCQVAAGSPRIPGFGVGFPVPCPGLLPRGARPSHAVCLGRKWSFFVIPSCVPLSAWATGSVDFPAPGRVGHLYLQGAPGSLSPERFVYGLSPPDRGVVRVGKRIVVHGWAARWLIVPEGSRSPFAGHVVLFWRVRTRGPYGGTYTYGVSFHGHDRGAYALALAIARSIMLVPASNVCPPGYTCG